MNNSPLNLIRRKIFDKKKALLSPHCRLFDHATSRNSRLVIDYPRDKSISRITVARVKSSGHLMLRFVEFSMLHNSIDCIPV